jgi:hypothetical protein
MRYSHLSPENLQEAKNRTPFGTVDTGLTATNE